MGSSCAIFLEVYLARLLYRIKMWEQTRETASSQKHCLTELHPPTVPSAHLPAACMQVPTLSHASYPAFYLVWSLAVASSVLASHLTTAPLLHCLNGHNICTY